jgi:hypothetical protein
MNAPQNWQQRNEYSAMLATAQVDQCEYTSFEKAAANGNKYSSAAIP